MKINDKFFKNHRHQEVSPVFSSEYYKNAVQIIYFRMLKTFSFWKLGLFYSVFIIEEHDILLCSIL